MLRSQGPLLVVPYQCFPSNAVSRFGSSSFCMLLLRRLWLHFPPSSCGRLLDVLGHHHACCAEAGVLGRGYALESAAAICREAGPGWAPISWFATRICCLRTIRMGAVSKWWRTVLPLFHGAQLAIDTTLVSPLGRGGLPLPRSGRSISGTREKEGEDLPRAHWAVRQSSAGEVGGRWSEETQAFLTHLAKAKAQSEAGPRQGQRWVFRWRALLACSSAMAFEATRGWKLLLLFPRMILFRPSRGGVVPRGKLGQLSRLSSRRLELFAKCAEKGQSQSVRRRRRQQIDDGGKRLSVVHMGDCATSSRRCAGGSRHNGHSWSADRP